MSEKSNKSDKIQSIGKIVLYKNMLIFENTAFQISNISTIWVADHSYKIKNEFPTWISWLTGVGILLIIGSIAFKSIFLAVISIAALASAFLNSKSFVPETAISEFALGIELNSGSRTLFAASELDFIKKAASSLLDNLTREPSETERLIVNFTDKRVYVDKVDKSVIVAGDVSNSLVENFS